MKKRFSVLIIVFVLFLSFSVVHASDIFDQLMKQQENAVKVFPDPFDKKMTKMLLLEDRIVYLWREHCKSRFEYEQGRRTGLNHSLNKALLDKMRFLTGEFIIAFEKKYDKSLKNFPKYLNGTSNYDKAAFSVFFNAVNSEYKTTLLNQEENVKRQFEKLKQVDNLGEYVGIIKKTPEFFKKIPWWKIPARTTAEKIKKFINRLKQRFSAENTLRTLNWLKKRTDGKIQEKIIRIQNHLIEYILGKIDIEIRGQIRIGIDSQTITEIRDTGNGIMTKTALFKGALRTFVKKYQIMETRDDRSLFNPVMSKIKSVLKKILFDNRSNAEGKKYLEEMIKTLDNVILFSKMKKPENDYKPTTVKLFKLIEKSIREIDEDHLIF